MQGWKRETTHNIQEGSDWLRGYRCSDESGNEMGAHILNEVEVWRFHFKAIFPYLRISNAPPRCNRIERASEQASEDWLAFAILPCSLTPSRSPADSDRVHACFRHCGGLHHHTQVPPPPPPSFLRPSFVARSTTGKEGKGCDEPTDADARTVGRIEGGSRRGCGVPCRRGFACSAFFRKASKVEGDVARQTEGGAARAANSQLYPLGAGGLASGRGRAPSSDRSTPSKPWSKLLSVQ